MGSGLSRAGVGFGLCSPLRHRGRSEVTQGRATSVGVAPTGLLRCARKDGTGPIDRKRYQPASPVSGGTPGRAAGGHAAYSAAMAVWTAEARAAQNLNSGILPIGSSAGFVSRLAAASA